jgi:tetratricopeptide (TPR) repeat protein
VTPAQMIDAAADLHRAGRLPEAEHQYRQVLTIDPQNSDALHLLGILNSQLGREEFAADLIARAIARNPHRAIYHGNLGLTLHRLGRFADSIASFEKALSLGTNDPNVLNNFGDVLRASGNTQRAISLFQHAMKLAPEFADPHNNLGMTLAEIGKIDEAIAEYRVAIQLNPRLAQVYNNLGNALVKKRLVDPAILAFEEALKIRADYPEALMNLSVALKVKHEDYRALKLLERALELRPNFFEALLNYGQSLCDEHRFKEAIDVFRKAIALKPDDPSAHFHLSGVLLLTGDFSQGWREYEWRTLRPEGRFTRFLSSKPAWTGQDPTGKRILIHAEQGAGDTIQFSRLVTTLAQRGAQPILSCPPQLLRLLRTLDGVSHLITNTQECGEFDSQCYLLSLPLLLGLKPDTIPASIPYLRAQPDTIEYWRARLEPLGPGKKIGLAWAGNPDHTNDHNRSIPLSKFAPLAAIPGVTFISLQKGAGSEQTAPTGLKLIDHTPEIYDYADSAGLIANLDLVISPDTSVAHLAGAMGKPVYTLLPFHPDLRWMLNRPDSPWYPTMRLFRQSRLADWDTPIRAIAEALVLLPSPAAPQER